MIRSASSTAAAALAAITSVVFGFAAQSLGADDKLIVETATGRVIVNPSTGEAKPAPTLKAEGVVSPDGKRVAFIRRVEKSDELFVADVGPDGAPGNERRLTSGAQNARDPQWTPEGNAIVYVRGTQSQAQVYKSDLTAERPTEMRISGGRQQSWMPRIAPDGSIAYLVLTDQKQKQSFVDLIVQKGGEKKTIVSGEDITAIVWSPDGAQIAWSTHGGITIHSVKTAANNTIDFMKGVDEKLYAHHARSLAWRPDGTALAAVINFSGGRAAPMNAGPDYEFPPILGDREVFIVPLDGGKAKWFTLKADVRVVAWTRD